MPSTHKCTAGQAAYLEGLWTTAKDEASRIHRTKKSADTRNRTQWKTMQADIMPVVEPAHVHPEDVGSKASRWSTVRTEKTREGSNGCFLVFRIRIGP